MQQSRLELSITSTTKYADSIPYLAMGNARRLGFSSSADMFTQAFKAYDEEMPSNVLAFHSACNTSVKFLEKFKIRFKNDIFYVLRHPEKETLRLIEEDADASRRRRIFNFDPDTNDPDQISACSYLQGLKPRERTGAAARIIEQYLIMSNNDYYFEQSAMRLFQYLCKNAEFDATGNAQEEIIHLVDLIWRLGQK